MPKRISIIANPTARGNRAKGMLKNVSDSLAGVHLVYTDGEGSAEGLAREAARDSDVVVAAGGDGTVNEVVNGMADSGAALGVLPVGTVNVFAQEMGIPLNLRQAVEVLRNGRIRKIDLASANEHCFVQMAGVGYDAEIVKATDVELKKLVGPLAYIITATQLAGQRFPRVLVREKGGNEQGAEGSFVLVGNGRYYGGPLHFFPEASNRDGLLDICVFEKLTHIDILRYVQGIMTGQHTRYGDVRYFQAREVRITSEEVTAVEVDGEAVATTPLTVKVRKRRLRVLVPGGSGAKKK